MGAVIAVNNFTVATATDQFLRYVVALKSSGAPLHPGANANLVTVTFDPEILTLGRYMACTGGWDWAPGLSRAAANHEVCQIGYEFDDGTLPTQ